MSIYNIDTLSLLFSKVLIICSCISLHSLSSIILLAVYITLILNTADVAKKKPQYNKQETQVQIPQQ